MQISWGRAGAGALIAEIAQIAAAFGWVAFYSYLINPGQPMAQYQVYAQASGPWVSILAGAPIFYAGSRWIARSRPTALALFAIFVVIDGALLVGMTESWTGAPFCPDRTQLSHQTLRLRTRRTPRRSPALLVHIQPHLEEDLSRDLLSAKTSLSPAHFQRTVQALVGETPKNYVARLRLERAPFRLLIHDATLPDIALDCGFQNHETVTRAFRRRFGMPPSSYRAWVRTQAQQCPEAAAEQPDDAYSISETKIRRLRRGILRDAHAGPFVTLPAAYAAIFPRVTKLPKHQLIGLPAVEIYQTARVNARLQLNVTDICLPVVGSGSGPFLGFPPRQGS